MVHTGQHYDPNMSQTFFDELEMALPNHNLSVASGDHGSQTGEMLKRLAVYLHPAAKCRRLTPRLSQEQKGLDERARMASQWPSPPGYAFDAGHVTARRLLRPPPRAASYHPACSYPH